MTGDSRLARAIPFPEFAPDHVLRFTTADLIELECLYSMPTGEAETVEGIRRRLTIPWMSEIERRLKINDAKFVTDAVRLGVKLPGGFDRPEFTEKVLGDLPFSPGSVTQKIADGILCAISGRSYADIMEERAAAEAAASA